jgi:hypothetical protein
MPIVRIVGPVPEGIRDLPQQLRARGFDVETVSDSANCGPGTFEITLEEWSTEETLSRALALAEGDDIAILVSPGAIVPATAVVASLEDQIPTAADAPGSVPDVVSPAASEPIDLPASLPEPLPAYFACETHFGAPPEVATTTTTPAETLHPEEEPAVADETEVFVQPADVRIPASAEPVFRPVTEQQDKPAVSPDTDWVQFEPLAALSLNADDDSDWPIWQRGGEDEQVPPSALEVPQPESPIWTEHVAVLHRLGRRFLAAAQVNRILSDDRVFTRIAACSTAVAILVLMVGLIAHRFSPLPSRILHRSSQGAQPAPFQRPAAARNPMTASEVVPADATEPAAPGVIPASAHSRVRRSSKPASGRSHKRSSGDSDLVAKDTVVRFNQRRSQSLPQTAKKQPGIKYYTDLKQ